MKKFVSSLMLAATLALVGGCDDDETQKADAAVTTPDAKPATPDAAPVTVDAASKADAT
ncbi:MAG: hypothetical protein HY698_07500 [Deltaproteobacteria bacterium]|nr:hypothetical protein [Deltaproteobacteria bacterium]